MGEYLPNGKAMGQASRLYHSIGWNVKYPIAGIQRMALAQAAETLAYVLTEGLLGSP
jgi:hypothetical protein